MGRRFDLIFSGGDIYDGTGCEPVTADIAVAGDRIAAIGKLDHHSAGKVFPVRGLAVAPGFIDTHAHSDFTLLADPRAAGKVSQGITTEINGNCGMSAAPLVGRVIDRREADLKELGIEHRWNTLAQYHDLLGKSGIALNCAMLAGHGNIRGAVIGYENRNPDRTEMLEMRRILHETLAQGAIGLSTGLIYPPGTYTETEELVSLCINPPRPHFIYASHMRSEGSSLIEAVQEVLTIGRQAACPVHISHIKTAGDENWGKADAVLSLLAGAIAEGVRVTCDCYPYTASSTDLDTILPSWTYEGGNDAELARIRDAGVRRLIRKQVEEKIHRADYWDRVVISSVSTTGNEWMEGLTVRDIAGRLGLDGLDAVFRILDEEELRAGAIFRSMSEENKRKFLALPYCMIGSDSSARSFDGPTRRGKPHPRTFGTFPRFFRTYVLQDGIMSLAEAVRRTTSLPADTFGLAGRGRLAEGMHADIVVFDPSSIADTATYDEPYRKAEGVRFVVVNGVLALAEGELTDSRSGRVIRSTG